jgi:hypothetical protein
MDLKAKKSVTEVGYFIQKHSVQCTSVICLAHTGASLLQGLNEDEIIFFFYFINQSNKIKKMREAAYPDV